MKVRIRKAGPGEKPGYKSKLNKFIPKAENGGEATAMMGQLIKAAYKVLATEQAEPEQVYKNLLAQEVEPQLAMEIIRRAVALAQEDKQLQTQTEPVNQEIQNEEEGAKAAIAEEAAKQNAWEKLKLYNQQETDQLFMQDEQDYANAQAENEAVDADYDEESEEEFNNMMFDDNQQKYGGLTKAQFGYEQINSKKEAPELSEDQLIDNVFKMYKGRETEIPSEIDKIIAKTPGIQKLHFPGIEEYIPQYSALSVTDMYQAPNPFDAMSKMRMGGMTKKSFVKQMMKKYAEGGEDENVDEGGDEEKPTPSPTPMDTQNQDVKKMKDGFIDSVKMTAKEKTFGDFWNNAAPEIKNLEFIKQGMQSKPMAQDGYMVPENDFTHYTHGADDVFNQDLNEYVNQLGGFVDPNRPDLNKFVYGGPDYMDKNTADPYSRAEFQGYGKYGVSVGNIRMARGGVGPGGKNPDEATEETKPSLDPVVLAQALGIKDLPTAAVTNPYDIITPERINYQYVPTSGGRIGLANALLPWNPFRSYQRYNMQIPLSALGPEQYPWYSIRNLDNMSLPKGKRAMNKFLKQIGQLNLGQGVVAGKKSLTNDIKEFWGEDNKSWSKLSAKNKRSLKQGYLDAMERQQMSYAPEDFEEEITTPVSDIAAKEAMQESFPVADQSLFATPEIQEQNKINMYRNPMFMGNTNVDLSEDVEEEPNYNYNQGAYTPFPYVTPIYQFGGEEKDKCPEGYKKDPVSGMCRDDAGNLTFPTFTPSTTSNFKTYNQEANTSRNTTTDEPFGNVADKAPMLKPTEIKTNLPDKLKSNMSPNQRINIGGRLVTTDYESGINQLQAAKYAAGNILGNWGRGNRENQMLMDNANIMNLVSRTPMMDRGDHGELGSGYGQFRTYGAEQQSRTAFGKTGGTFKRGGSKMEYNIGDELYMTEAEIADFIKKGGKLEFV